MGNPKRQASRVEMVAASVSLCIPLRRVEKFKNLRRNIFRVGKYVYVLGGLKKVV